MLGGGGSGCISILLFLNDPLSNLAHSSEDDVCWKARAAKLLGKLNGRFVHAHGEILLHSVISFSCLVSGRSGILKLAAEDRSLSILLLLLSTLPFLKFLDLTHDALEVFVVVLAHIRFCSDDLFLYKICFPYCLLFYIFTSILNELPYNKTFATK